MTQDPNAIYTLAIAHSYTLGGNVQEEFERARDKLPKTALMAAVLAGYLWAQHLSAIGVVTDDGR